MTVEDHISRYLEGLPEPKQGEMRILHSSLLEIFVGGKLWFFDGKDETGKVVSNPCVGYGAFTKQLANGTRNEQFQAGISANAAGLSVYIMGLDDKKYLPEKYGDSIGRAKVTGYCIKFKALKNIQLDILKAAIRDGMQQTRD